MSTQTNKLGMAMLFGAWGIFLGLLTYFFHNWYLAKENPNQTVQSLILEDGSHRVVLQANYQSQYLANGYVNAYPVTFLIDTGATHVVIAHTLAERLKLPIGQRVLAKTAGGDSFVSMTELDEIRLGNIRVTNVPAVVSEHISNEVILLGMSALRGLELNQQDNQLTITLPQLDES